jgi:hypothetical protein
MTMDDPRWTIDIWNRAIELRSPHVPDLESISGRRISRFTEDNRYLFALGSNLLLQLPLVRPDPVAGRVNSIVLVVRHDSLTPHALVRPDDLPSFQLLGVRLPASAAETLAALRAAGSRELTLTSEMGRWDIIYGKTLDLRFRADEELDTDPAHSKLVSVSLSYLAPYTGDRPATITLD